MRYVMRLLRPRDRWSTGLVAVFLATALFGSVFVACGDDGNAGNDSAATGDDPAGGQIVVYSGRNEELIRPILDDFSEETGVSVDVRWGDSAELALLIDQEGDRSPADVFISQSPGAVGFLTENERLGQLPGEITSLVAGEDAADDGTWVSVTGRVRVVVYNTDLVDPDDLPDSVLDLTDPQYGGQVAIAPTNGSFQDFVTVLRNEIGDEATLEWLEGMAAGNPPTFDGNTAIVEAVGRGEVPMGLVNHYYAFAAKDEAPNLPVENHYFPDGDYGSTMLSSAVSLVDGANNPEAAVRLVEFLLSDEGQDYFTNETFEFPLRLGAEPNPALPDLEDIHVTRIDFGELGGGLEPTIDLIEESGLTG
jgi:iron(III) transport system substrate-binding protein